MLSKSLGRLDILDFEEERISFEVEIAANRFGKRDVLSLIHFDAPYNCIVSSSRFNVRMWSLDTCELLDHHSKSSRYSHLEKMDENTFLFARMSGKTTECVFSCSLSAVPNHLTRSLEYLEMEFPVAKIVKVKEDIFLCQCVNTQAYIYVCSFSKNEIIRRISAGQCYWRDPSPLIPSQNHADSFYFGASQSPGAINLFDYEKIESVKLFRAPSPVHSLCLYFNPQNEEILIASGDSNSFYFFNSCHPQSTEHMSLVGHYHRTQRVNCLLCLNNRYLLCGDQQGCVSLLQISERGDAIIRKKKMQIHDRCVSNILILPSKSNCHPDEVRLVSSSHNTPPIILKKSESFQVKFRQGFQWAWEVQARGPIVSETIKKWRVFGLFGKSQEMENDRKERREFLVRKMEKYYFGNSNYVLGLHFEIEKWNVSRIWFGGQSR